MVPDRQPRRPRSEPAPSEPHRENVPGALDHASGDIDEFEAALISGANGTPDETADIDVDDREPATVAPRRRGTPSPASHGPRFWVFLKACWAELQRVQWPDRGQVGQATAVVLGFVIVAGVYLGIADWAAQKLVNFIL